MITAANRHHPLDKGHKSVGAGVYGPTSLEYLRRCREATGDKDDQERLDRIIKEREKQE